MRYFKHPQPITKLTSASLDQPLTFKAFFATIVDNDARTGKNRAAGRMADKAVALVEGTSPGDTIAMPEAVYAFVKPIFEEPSSGYNPQIARSVGPWVDSILDASEVQPARTEPVDQHPPIR